MGQIGYVNPLGWSLSIARRSGALGTYSSSLLSALLGEGGLDQILTEF